MYREIPDYRCRLIDYVGDGFVIGSGVGPPYYFIRGLCNSPNGGRLAGGVHAVRTNVLPFCGKGAGLLAVFWALESSMSLARSRREDKWNSIVAGTGTFALVNIRRGARAAACSSLLAAMFYVGIELTDLITDSWHSSLIRSGREIGMQGGLPALVPVRRVSPCPAALRDAGDGVECRLEKDDIPDIFAMEQKPEMTPKDV